MLAKTLCAVALALGMASAPAARPLANGAFTAPRDERTIEYEVHGRGPVVIVLPNSWGLRLDALRAMYRPLESGLTLVYFNPRGMGASGPVRSDADLGMQAVREDFDALRRHLGVGRVAAIGWSNGAMNLLLLATERPDALSHVVLVHGIASWDAKDGAAFAAAHPEMAAKYGAFEKTIAAAELTDAQRTATLREFWSAEYFPFLLADRKRSGAALARMLGDQPFSFPHHRRTRRETAGYDVRAKLGTITAKALVVAGAKDSAPPAKVRAIADGIPDAKFVVFEASGHFAPIEETEKFQRTVVDFLTRE